jgi:ribonuclease D
LTTDIRLIQTQPELERLFERLSRESIVAVDTEAASFHRYRDRVYLLQLSSRRETAVVDPLALDSLAPLGELLADPGVEIVFHDADYDLRLLGQQYGFRGINLFDTRIAAQLLNEPGVGLAALLAKYFGVQLDKRFQRADWSARPLSGEMLAYAAADTRHLPDLRDLLHQQLTERGRLEWALEEFELLSTAPRSMPTENDEPGFLRIKGARMLRGRELAILRELYQWRDELARRSDKAAFRIMNNEPMLLMAKSPPTDLAGLKAVRGVSPDQVERRGRQILAAIQRGLAIPERDLPRIDPPVRRPTDPAYEARLVRLKSARNQLALALSMAPGVLCPNGTLEAIARAQPGSLEEMARLPELRRWQIRELGPELLKAIQPGK